MKIIGLGHYSRTGKDTLAKLIVDELPCDRFAKVIVRSFAWKLKEACHSLYSWAGLREAWFYEIPGNEHLRTEKIAALGLTPVEIWVKLGTDAIRENVYDKTWIDYLFNATDDCDVLIVPDVRFSNEVEAIHERGGLLVKVIRNGVGPKDTVADQALVNFNDWDYIAGPTIENLKSDAKYLAECIVSGERPRAGAAL